MIIKNIMQKNLIRQTGFPFLGNSHLKEGNHWVEGELLTLSCFHRPLLENITHIQGYIYI